jgi:probable FeS assembly SUF system protein SufT
MQSITTDKDLNAVLIPSGTPTTIPRDTELKVVQRTSSGVTLATPGGFLVQVAAEALGLPAEEPEKLQGDFSEEAIWQQLRTVYDPEIPIDIVELGLIYSLQIHLLESGDRRVTIAMTMTAPGCGMSEILRQEVRRKVLSVPSVREAEVEVVFDPPWTPDRLSEAARLQLGW